MPGRGAGRARGRRARAWLVVCALAALALLAPAGAQAAPAWLPPDRLSGPAPANPTFEGEGLEVAVGANGDTVAVWQYYRADGRTAVQAATRPAGGPWSTQYLSALTGGRDALYPDVAVDAAGNAVAVWQRSDDQGKTFVQAATRPAGDVWSEPQRLAPDESVDRLQVAMDGQGNALAVWSSEAGVRTASRPAGGMWSPAQKIPTAGGFSEFALNRQGDAVVVWNEGRVIKSVSRSAQGEWTPAVAVSGNDVELQSPQVALDARGKAVAVWKRDASRNGGPRTVQAAVRPPGETTWGTASDLSSADQIAATPRVAMDGQGNALAVWAASDPAPTSSSMTLNSVIQAASLPANDSGGWARKDLSSPAQNNSKPQVAVNARGDAVVVWERLQGVVLFGSANSQRYVVGTSRPAGGGWGEPRDVGRTTFDRFPQVAIDEQGNAAAVWSPAESSAAAAPSFVDGAGYDAAGPQLRDLRVPPSGVAGAQVTFSVSPVDVWSGTKSPKWDFGDGSRSTASSCGPNERPVCVSHAYAAPGSYVVTVTSTDSTPTPGNTSTASRTVVVTSPSAPGDSSSPIPGTVNSPTTGTDSPTTGTVAGGGTPTTAPATGAATTTTAPGTGGAQTGAPAPATRAATVSQRTALRRCQEKANRLATKARRLAARRRCTRPGRPAAVRARAISASKIVLSFLAPGTVAGAGPPARRYVIKQSERPITSERAFRRAQTLCRKTCAFAPQKRGERLSLTITQLRSKRMYYYAIKAVGVAPRTGSRSKTVRVRTR